MPTLITRGSSSAFSFGFGGLIIYIPYSMYFIGGSPYFTYLSITDSSNLTDIGSSNSTIEFWIYNTSSSSGTIFQKSGGTNTFSTSNGIQYAFALVSNVITFYYNNAGASATITGPTLNLYAWYHIAVTTNTSNNITLWVNGVSQGTATNAILKPITRTNILIATNVGSSTYFIGIISGLRITQQTLYTSSFTPPTAPLSNITNTQLLICQNFALVDKSSNNLALTNFGAITAYNPTNVFYSNYFNGTNSYISGPYNANTGIFASSTPFTIEAWIYLTTTPSSYATIYSNGGANSSSVDIFFAVNSSLKVTVGATNGWAGGNPATAASIALNTWYHVAAVRNSSNVISIYLNGIQNGTTNTYSSSITDPTGSIYIGYLSSNYGDYWAGYICNLRVSTTTAFYTSTFSLSYAPFTAIGGTGLLTCQSSSLVDNSSNNYTLTNNNQVYPVGFTPFGVTTFSNFFNGAVYLGLPNSSATLNFGSSNFTVECWVCPLATSALNTIFGIGQNALGIGSMAVIISGNAFSFQASTSSSSWTISQGGLSTAVAGLWYHIAIVRSGTSIYLFVNGTQVGTTGSMSGSIYYGTYNQIGCDYNGGLAYYFNGYISNFRINNTTALYTTNFTPQTTPLTAIANTVLLTCQSSTFTDASTSNLSITNTGSTISNTIVPF